MSTSLEKSTQRQVAGPNCAVTSRVSQGGLGEVLGESEALLRSVPPRTASLAASEIKRSQSALSNVYKTHFTTES